MPADSTSRTLIILTLLALLAGCVWLVRDVLPPFVIATVLALLLDPLMVRLHRAGLPRGIAVALTFAAFLAMFAGVLFFLVPRVIIQVGDLIRNLGGFPERFQTLIDDWIRQHAADLHRLHLPDTAPGLVGRYQGDILRYVQMLLTRVFGAVEQSAAAIGWVVIIPIVTLYLLADMEKIRVRLYHLIPARHREMVLDLTVKVGRVFVAYLRGLMMVCAGYGFAVYVLLELVLAVPYALVLSLAGAVLYTVPYLGQFTLMAVCCSVAWLSGRTPLYLVEIAIGLVVVGQCFDQVITPRVIGKQVGLHPVLGLFSLMVGAQLFGLLGMVFAVPVAAAVRIVLIRLFPPLAEPISREEDLDRLGWANTS